MRFNSQFIVETSITHSSSKMDTNENFDIASELSEEMNEINHSNNSTMMMSDSFSWKSISRPELGLSKITKSYAIFCEDGDTENIETNDFKQASTSK